jgi:hypothetical protein
VAYSLKKPDSYEQNLASEEGDEKPIKNADIIPMLSLYHLSK